MFSLHTYIKADTVNIPVVRGSLAYQFAGEGRGGELSVPRMMVQLIFLTASVKFLPIPENRWFNGGTHLARADG